MADKVQLLQDICATTVTEEEVDDLILDGFCLSCLNEMEATKCCCGRDLGYWPFFLKIQLCAVILNSYQIADFLIGMAAELITVQFGSRVTNYSWNGCYPWNKECTALNPDISIDPVSFFSGFIAAFVAAIAVDKYMAKYNTEELIATWIVAGDKRTWCGSIKSLIYFIFTILFWLLITTCVDQILTPYWSMTAQGVSCDIVYEPVPTCADNPCQGRSLRYYFAKVRLRNYVDNITDNISFTTVTMYIYV